MDAIIRAGSGPANLTNPKIMNRLHTLPELTGIPVRRIACALLLLCAGAGWLPGAAAQASQPAQPAQSAQSAQRPQIRTVDSIVAVVNNEVITYQELESRLQMVQARLKSQGGELPPREQLLKQLLERLIVDRAQMQLAKETGIRIDDNLLDRAVARIAEQNKMSLPQFRQQLESDGMPFARFREEIREEITMQRLHEREVDNKIQVAESEIDNYLAANAGAMPSGQPELNLAQILVRIPENASAEQIEARRKRADEVLQQLRSGADFARIAATYSDASEALTGGELGWRSQERLPQLFVGAVADRKPGEIAVVKSANGFHILKLLGRRDAAPAAAAKLPAVQQTHARHILIKVNQVVSTSDARRRLVELKERLDNKAATFEELAKLYSNDLSASRGGDLGWIYPGDTVPEFERAMDKLEPGQTSEPVESPFGFHLIQVIERKTDDVSEERQRLHARQIIRERKQQEATEDWLRQLRDRAYVEYRTEDLGALVH
jgi:peptidyl-prolyl cis-trans isomerase SurA